MTLDRLHTMAAGIPPVSVHLEGHMLRHRPLLDGADEELSELLNGPFTRRRFENESPENGRDFAHIVVRIVEMVVAGRTRSSE